MNRYILGWLLWLVFLAVWTVALLRPEPVTIQEVAVPSSWRYFFAKGFHVGTYGILTVWGGYLVNVATSVSLGAIRSGNTNGAEIGYKPIGFFGLLLLCHGALGEFLQTFTSKRHGSLVDVAWDGLGVIFGFLALWIYLSRIASSRMVSK
jgi:VanZ family protein